MDILDKDIFYICDVEKKALPFFTAICMSSEKGSMKTKEERYLRERKLQKQAQTENLPHRSANQG